MVRPVLTRGCSILSACCLLGKKAPGIAAYMKKGAGETRLPDSLALQRASSNTASGPPRACTSSSRRNSDCGPSPCQAP